MWLSISEFSISSSFFVSFSLSLIFLIIMSLLFTCFCWLNNSHCFCLAPSFHSNFISGFPPSYIMVSRWSISSCLHVALIVMNNIFIIVHHNFIFSTSEFVSPVNLLIKVSSYSFYGFLDLLFSEAISIFLNFCLEGLRCGIVSGISFNPFPH